MVKCSFNWYALIKLKYVFMILFVLIHINMAGVVFEIPDTIYMVMSTSRPLHIVGTHCQLIRGSIY